MIKYKCFLPSWPGLFIDIVLSVVSCAIIYSERNCGLLAYLRVKCELCYLVHLFPSFPFIPCLSTFHFFCTHVLGTPVLLIGCFLENLCKDWCWSVGSMQLVFTSLTFSHIFSLLWFSSILNVKRQLTSELYLWNQSQELLIQWPWKWNLAKEYECTGKTLIG